MKINMAFSSFVENTIFNYLLTVSQEFQVTCIFICTQIGNALIQKKKINIIIVAPLLFKFYCTDSSQYTPEGTSSVGWCWAQQQAQLVGLEPGLKGFLPAQHWWMQQLLELQLVRGCPIS